MAAKNYTEILELVNAGNQMGLSNTIKRDYGIPLDFTSVQASYDDAVVYAATNTKAYVGQPLSVGGKLYIINDVAADAKHTVGEVEYNNYLVEVGSATEGDGVTIDLEEGVLTLHGFESALTGYLPRKAEDGSLEWVPISAVVQGDGNKVTTLTSEDGSVVITKKTDTDESLVYDLSVVHPDAPEYAVKADERAEGATATTYHLTKDGENVDVAIVVPDAYNDTALAGRVSDVETAVNTTIPGLIDDVDAKFADYTKTADLPTDLGDFTNNAGYAKTADVNTELAKKADKSAYDQTVLDLDALEARVDAFLTGTGAEGALDSLQELIAYIDEHDGADLTEMIATLEGVVNKLAGIDTTVVAYVTAAIDALKIGDYAKAADLTELAGRVKTLEDKPFDTYATKDEVSAARTGAVEDVAAVGYALATEVANTYATKDELTDHSNTMDTKLNDYAKTVDVNAELAKKIETGTIAHTSETNATEGVTVDGTALKIVVDAYTKQEVRDYVADVIEDMTGGESAADVLLALNNHIATYEEKVGAIDEKNGAQDTAIAAAQTQADKGVTDAAAAKSVADSAKGIADKNTTDIASLAKIVSGENAEDKTSHAYRIGALEAHDLAHATEFSTLSGKVDKNIQDIAKKANAADVYTKGEVDGLVNVKANTTDVYTKAEIALYSKSEIDNLLANLDQSELEQGIADNKAAIEAIYKVDGETKSGILVSEIARVEKAYNDSIVALVGTDTGKTIRAIAAEETAKIVAGADTDYDTLKEIADFIKNDTTGAAAMANDIAALKEKVDTGDQKVSEYVAAQIAAIPAYNLPAATLVALGGIKASDKFGVNEDGTVASVSTDLLTQGADELILNGGGANA